MVATNRVELPRRIMTGRIGAAGTEILVEANEEERAAVARRLAIPAVAVLRCRFRLGPVARDGVVAADGLLTAEVTRVCVVTLEEFPVRVAEPFSIRFVPAARFEGLEEDSAAPAVLDPDADDEIPYSNETLDLGEASVEQLALALDPYPRKPDAVLPAGVGRGDPPAQGEDPAGVVGEPDEEGAGEGRPNPFAALARLQRKDD